MTYCLTLQQMYSISSHHGFLEMTYCSKPQQTMAKSR